MTGRNATWIMAAVFFFSIVTPNLNAQERTVKLGGHVGMLLPLVTGGAPGGTTNIGNNFQIGFPTGITIKGSGRTAFDMEFVPVIQDSPRNVSLTFHPGFLYSVGHGFTPGLRAAFNVNSTEWGFTPLLNKGWAFKSEDGFFKSYFVEADLPIRFDHPSNSPAYGSVTFAMHFGLGF